MATDAAPANWRDQLKLPPKDTRIRTEVSVVALKAGRGWGWGEGAGRRSRRWAAGGGLRRQPALARDAVLCPPPLLPACRPGACLETRCETPAVQRRGWGGRRAIEGRAARHAPSRAAKGARAGAGVCVCVRVPTPPALPPAHPAPRALSGGRPAGRAGTGEREGWDQARGGERVGRGRDWAGGRGGATLSLLALLHTPHPTDRAHTHPTPPTLPTPTTHRTSPAPRATSSRTTF